MSDFPACPQCGLENTYHDGSLLVCPDCGHEWVEGEAVGNDEGEVAAVVRDSNGNVLADGDTVVVTKDLPVKGGSGPIKQGTVFRDIRLGDVDGHIYDRKSKTYIKTEFLRKQ